MKTLLKHLEFSIQLRSNIHLINGAQKRQFFRDQRDCNKAYQTWFIIPKIAQVLIISATSYCKVWKKCIIGSQKTQSNIPKETRYSERTLRILLQKPKRNPFASSCDLKKDPEPYGIINSAEHIRRILREKFNLNGYRAAGKPLLTKSMRRRRLEFAKRYAAFSLENWAKVLFYDETMIRQFYQRVIVPRPPGTKYLQRYVLKTVNHPISNMIWGCISRNGCSQLEIYETGNM